MISDGVAVVCLLWGTIQGYRHGLVSALVSFVSLVGGYGAAWAFSRPVGVILQRRFEFPDLLIAPLGGLMVFMLVGLSVRILGYILEKILEKIFGELAGRKLFKFGGAVAGLARGGMFAVFFVSLVLAGRSVYEEISFEDPPDPSLSEQVALLFMEKLK
ncbi:MAG: hypothetical protein COB53_01520 [Elusimicrobia bacterium]|nr:MAG: hypothetical protein COB53_01520 [Elusimicrobiota bacterium]